MSDKPVLLLIDDEQGVIDTLSLLLNEEGFEVVSALKRPYPPVPKPANPKPAHRLASSHSRVTQSVSASTSPSARDSRITGVARVSS